MVFVRQTWTLCAKTLRIVFLRHWLGTLTRAFLAPIIFSFIISYSKNFFVPPSDFGIGTARTLRSLSDAVGASAGGRNTVVFVDNGFTGGDISRVIEQISASITAQGKTIQNLQSRKDMLTTCPSTIRGVSPCFAAVVFESSPTEGPDGIWNYTIQADGSFGERIYVDSDSNDAEIYALPLQHAIDNAIASLNGTTLPDNVQQYPFTSQNSAERDRSINRAYMGALIDILGVAYFIGIVGICYQLTGQMAQERELGMSQLIEAMMPNKQRWLPQAARLLAMHVSFDILYFPSWVIMGIIVGVLNYPKSNLGIPLAYFIISGLALSSWSIAFASLFRKSQLSGITVTIVSIVLAIIIQVVGPVSTGAAAILSLLFPSINFTLFIIYMAHWQQQSLPTNLAEAAPNAPWRIPGYVFFVFCAIQFLVYPFIGAIIERTLFGTASKSRQLRYATDDTAETVKVTSLSKHYPPGWFARKIMSRLTKHPQQTVFAVNNVDFSVLRGQIMVLLGANGSGKSTTLDTLAGLQKPTSGTIEMDATGGVGLCPQKNVLWNELTVYEHVKIFNRLKADTVDSKLQMQELVSACDLDLKINARTETLSGGQKRKCQLAMMLTGGSRICMLDEVSSGLDPLSRRKIWDIILAERGKRSMLLTTHFLDEADLLSDDIMILSKGNLVAHGSAVELKHHLGGGYRVRIYKEDEKALPEKLAATPNQVYHDQTVYNLTDSAAVAHFIAELERSGVRDYQVNGPTIEDVFLKLAEEVKEELEKDREPSPTPSTVDAVDAPVHEKGLKLIPGKNLSFLGQTWVLFRKRATILRRNKWPYLAALLIPIIAAGLVTLFVQDLQPLSCDPSAQVSEADIANLASELADAALIPAGPSGQVPAELLNQPSFRPVDSLTAFNDFVVDRYHNVTPGGFFIGDTPTFAYRGNYGLNFAVVTQNLLDVSLSGVDIATSYRAFATPFAPDAGQTLQFILYFGLAMCAFPGFFALYTNIERLRNVRALHYSNGVRAGPLWIAYTAFDFVIVLLVSAISVIIFVGASDVYYAPGYLFVVFALYGLSATLMSYVVSLFTTSQLATFAFAAGGQCCFFLLYFVAYMCIITYSQAADIDHNVTIMHFTLALIFPSGNLLRALLLTFNEFSLLCRGRQTASYPGDITVYGGTVLYLILQSAILIGVLVWYDSGWRPGFLARSSYRAPDAEEIEDVDPEVYGEAARIEDSQDQLKVQHVTKAFGSNVAVDNVSFGVTHGETFALLGPNGAGKSTTIGLIRGDTRPSGKAGDILIEETSIIRHRAVARANLGVCPQFDAMDQMTAIEHLKFYARARGVRDVEHNVDQVVHAVGLAPFKNRMAAKLSGGNKRKLSLGIALMGNPSVLLLDEPSSGLDAASKRVMWRTLRSVSEGRSLVLTTHSMEEADALADRAGIMAKRMLALGTSDELRKKHGDAHHVHVVHKDAPYSTDDAMNGIKTFIRNTFPGATTEERVFHGQLRFSVPNDRTAHQNDEYSLDSIDLHDKKGALMTVSPASGLSANSISALFQQLEQNKETLGFGYYGVSQATLDQVFLSIVSKHNVQEENYQKTHKQHLDTWGKVKKGVATVYHNA
ncbi:ATP-binding cassette sub-family A member 17 [Fulvia fulva]|uniref:ATP-binding cassette sub-family A member 17 n=1 Tax=Passalora fulva TaxID=5499 RepID=A0A9Q8L9K9_PASFU|nr:ATP-binding cassette sub-family A member 17 [Fulvia fulva]KAK4631454.1 ATP-binding cassette sub-family A member 17 [Fulvia fulva]KAK4633381.1 ATP-binding cassette sub-family A member 17 [Fulvia fulva]UJO13461.1 ATP-binding cassette sub-family A member 17 [Fulvia fulva]WPV12019.1 ATP-binding cassette sub-family A member 17 [Fulvia fulva]WPV26367.1 ATP-binding cassette sub-family A member 17 [Fulvia fulva]